MPGFSTVIFFPFLLVRPVIIAVLLQPGCEIRWSKTLYTHTSTAHVYTYHTDLGTNGELVGSTLPLNEKSTIRNFLASRFF